MGHRLLHLHGGIQFGRREYGADPNRFCYEDSFHELYWHPTAESAQRTIWGSSPPRSGSGRTLEGGPIVTGLHKADKLLIEPLASYYAELSNQVQRCERLLDMELEYGSEDRDDMLVMVQRWSEERFDIDDRHPYPWCSGNGCARFYFKGLLEAGKDVEKLKEFLGT